jgi:hypothetical protein
MRVAFRFSIFVAAGLVAALLPPLWRRPNHPNARISRLPAARAGRRSAASHLQREEDRPRISGDGNLIEVFMSSAGSFHGYQDQPSGASLHRRFREGWQSY